MAPNRFGNDSDGSAAIRAVDAVDKCLETIGKNADVLFSRGDARGRYFPSSSLLSSATFAHSIASEISTPGKASSIALRASESFAG